MKKLLYTLLAATLCFTACRKQQTASPVASEVITDDDFNGSKATIAGLHMKKTDDGLEYDYDLVIKEIADNKYEAGIKIHGLKVNGKKPKGTTSMAIFGVVLGLNTTKEDKPVPKESAQKPLSVTLTVKDIKELADGKIIKFPSFSYDGDLAFDLIDVHSSIIVDGGNIEFHDTKSMTFDRVNITVDDPNINLLKPDWDIQPNTTVKIVKDAGHENISEIMFTNFAILFNGIKGSEKCSVDEDNTFFVLPKGHTVEQNPELAKIRTQETGKESYGYVTLVVSGDPDRNVTDVQYRPEPVSANDPKDPKATVKLPVMDFKETHYNQKNGIRRFVSTQTWDAVYGKTPVKGKPAIDRKHVYHLCHQSELSHNFH